MAITEACATSKEDKRPVVLLVAGNWWPSSARLALAFAQDGCTVAAVCPPGHPLRFVSCVADIFSYHALTSMRSLVHAIHAVRPDIVVPCDDRSASQLHELHRREPELRPLIETSLGAPGAYEVLGSRDGVMKLAAELGIRVPKGSVVTSDAQAAACHTSYGTTSLVKLDGTYGGDGVQIVHSAAEAMSAFRRLSANAGAPTVIKRLLVNRDPLALWSWRRRKHPSVTMQKFIDGTPANCMVACWRGELLGEVSVQAISCQGPTGAANVVQLIDNEEIQHAARILASRLGLSGFFGLDFVIEHASGAAFLIELNPRCTQLGHLQMPKGDLAAALSAALRGQEPPSPKWAIQRDTIAFFPQAWQWGARSAFLSRVHHDVPWEEPGLIRVLMRNPWPDRQLLARLYNLFRRYVPPQAQEFAPVSRSAGQRAQSFSQASHK